MPGTEHVMPVWCQVLNTSCVVTSVRHVLAADCAPPGGGTSWDNHRVGLNVPVACGTRVVNARSGNYVDVDNLMDEL